MPGAVSLALYECTLNSSIVISLVIPVTYVEHSKFVNLLDRFEAFHRSGEEVVVLVVVVVGLGGGGGN